MDQVVRVPRRTRPRLLIEEQAERLGVEPVELLRQALSSTPTIRDAAATLGVSVPTLIKYRKIYGIQIVEEE